MTSQNGFEQSRPRASVPTLTTFVGTNGLCSLNFPELLPPGEIIAIDAKDELDRLTIREVPGRHIRLVPIASHETLQRLVHEFGTSEQAAMLAAVPNASAQNGLGQLRGIGGCAMHMLLNQGELDRHLRENVLPELAREAGGVLDRVVHEHWSGLAGGMGSLAGRIFCEYLQEIIIDECDCPVESVIHLVGSATFSGAEFARAKENASVAIAEHAHHLNQPKTAQASTQLVCSELFPFGKDKARRDHQMLEQQQAMAAPEIAEDQNRDKPNKTVSGPVGGTRLVRCDHFRRLEDIEMACDAAAVYVQDLNAVQSAQADAAIVEQAGVLPSQRALRRPSIDGLMEDALLFDVDELLEQVQLPGYQHSCVPYVQLKSGDELRLANVQRTFSAPIMGTGDAANRLQRVRTCKACCEREITERTIFRDDLIGQIEDAWLTASKRLRQLRGGLFVLRSEEARIDRAENSLAELRKLSDERHRLDCELESFEVALTQLEEVEARLLAPLKRLSRELHAIVSERPDGHAALIDVVPIDERYGELMNLAEREGTQVADVIQLLARSTKFCTLSGLGRIVGADPSIEAIARAVTDENQVIYRCPPWGGAVNAQAPDQYVVFPPVSESVKSMLGKQLQSIGGPMVAFADTALGSVNVVLVEVVHASQPEELVTRYYRSGINRALNSDLAKLFVDDAEAVTRFAAEPPQQKSLFTPNPEHEDPKNEHKDS